MSWHDVPPPLELAAPATADQATIQRRQFEQWIIGCVDEDTAADLTLAVSEALANAAEHASAGHAAPATARLTATVVDDEVRIIVADDGTWVPPDDNRTDYRGRGLRLMHALTSEVTVEVSVHGTTVHLGRRLVSPDRDPGRRR